ncbi:MAG: glycerophosphodiester phosphodiesterase [Spirochaetaceae bacterium]|nr:MAG: glycerophosphodiester phosphodiesterase [Spirochaetaceae bacterium]
MMHDPCQRVIRTQPDNRRGALSRAHRQGRTVRMRRSAKIVGVVLAAVAVAWVLMAVFRGTPRDVAPHWKADGDGMPRVIAHQGGNQERPGQTNLAFAHAHEIGVDVFELDVVLTADNRLAVIHDHTVDRATDGTGRVADMSYAEIRALDAGYGLEDEHGQPIRDPERNPFIGAGAYVPSLRELFETYPQMPMLIEIKDDNERGAIAADVLWALIDEFGRHDLVVVASFNRSPLEHFRSLSGGRVTMSGSMGEVVRFYAPHVLGLNALNNATPFSVFNLPVSFDVGPVTVDLTSRRLRRDIGRRGMALHYWTINSDEQMIRLIDLGVDGIITDRPSRLQELIAERRRR